MSEPTPPAPPPRHKPRTTGWMVILAIFAVGFAFLAGLYLTAWLNVPPDYRAAQPGVPPKTLRLACRDFGFKPADWNQVAADLRAADADFLLLTGLSRKDAHDLAAAAGMRHDNHLQAFYSHGCAILARHRLHKGQVLSGSVEGACVVMAEPVIDGRRFLLACMDLPAGNDERALAMRDRRVATMLKAWTKLSSLPAIVGGHADGLSASPFKPVSANFLVSPEWRIVRAEGAFVEVAAQ